MLLLLLLLLLLYCEMLTSADTMGVAKLSPANVYWWFGVFGFWFLVFGFWFLVSGFWYLIVVFCCLVLGIADGPIICHLVIVEQGTQEERRGAG